MNILNSILYQKEFVNWVQTHNEIEGDQIFPGEEIIIPVSSKSSMTNELASAANK